MMTVFIHVLALIAGLGLLVKGADLFVDAASQLAERLGVPPLVVGLTVVALGTSAPEAAMAVASAATGANDMALAGVFGSNIVNTLVVLGVTAMVARVRVRRSTLRVEIPLVMGATALLLVLCAHDGQLGRVDALMLLALLTTHLVALVRGVRTQAGKGVAVAADATREKSAAAGPCEGGPAETRCPGGALVVQGLLAVVAIFVGARLAVGGASELAQLAGVSARVVGLTVVAVGTSLPELVTSLAATRRGQADLAVGNVVGSSLLNVLFVLGASGAIAPMPFSAALLFDGLVSLAAVAVLWAVSVRSRSLGRGGGAVLLGCYGTYLAAVLAG